MPKDQAERVVEGAMHLSPHLGKQSPKEALRLYPLVVAAGPKDRNSAVDCSGRDKGSQLLAGGVGEAHARQMDAHTRASWFKELERNRSTTLGTPSWLWSSGENLATRWSPAPIMRSRLLSRLPCCVDVDVVQADFGSIAGRGTQQEEWLLALREKRPKANVALPSQQAPMPVSALGPAALPSIRGPRDPCR